MLLSVRKLGLRHRSRVFQKRIDFKHKRLKTPKNGKDQKTCRQVQKKHCQLRVCFDCWDLKLFFLTTTFKPISLIVSRFLPAFVLVSCYFSDRCGFSFVNRRVLVLLWIWAA